MKHARPDYDRIQDPAGLIPDDEPVFLIRGQDMYGALILAKYAELLETSDCAVDPRLIEMVRDQQLRMRHWPKKKIPDLP